MTSFLNLSRIYKQMIAAAADVIFLPAIFFLAIWLRYDSVTSELVMQYKWLIISAPLVSIPIFIKFGLYRAVIRFIDYQIIYVVIGGITLSLLILAACAVVLHLNTYSRGVFGFYWAGAIAYVTVSRFSARGYILVTTGGFGKKEITRVAIYGAGQAGTHLAAALKAVSEYSPVFFVDDNPDLQGATIGGVNVYSPASLPIMIQRTNVKEIFLAIPSLNRADRKAMLERLEQLKLKIKMPPPIRSLVNGELRLQDMRDIEIDDLLGRESVEPNRQLIGACITGKSVLVTGAGGSIGSELCRQILNLKPSRLLLLEISEFALYSIEQDLRGIMESCGSDVEVVPILGSVQDGNRCEEIFRAFSIDTVYHAAAYKHVPLVEHNPIEGIRNNVFGTLQVARAALSAGVSIFVLISTDKAVRPTNVMGATKRLAELILQAFARDKCAPPAKTKFCMVRFGNVLGSSGSVVPLFRKQISEGGPITITHTEITRYFMTIPEAAQLVLQAGAMCSGGEVFVLDMGQPIKIMDLAKRMVHLSGLDLRDENNPEGDIEIKAVGLRPGEKLYEELLIGGNVNGTEHPLILRAQEEDIPWLILESLLSELEVECDYGNVTRVRELLLLTVKEYAPQCGVEDVLWLKLNSRSQSTLKVLP
jgi:FlaA1/EpsC-like NDP-sugar epimerase